MIQTPAPKTAFLHSWRLISTEQLVHFLLGVPVIATSYAVALWAFC